jgi:hypothetical protein
MLQHILECTEKMDAEGDTAQLELLCEASKRKNGSECIRVDRQRASLPTLPAQRRFKATELVQKKREHEN